MPTPEEIQAAADAAKAEAEAKAKADEDSEEELTAEQLKAKLDESLNREKQLRAENKERRLKNEAFEKAEAERKQAELTEVEKANAKAKAAEEEKDRLAKENQTLKLQNSFVSKVRAMKLDFANELAAKDAFKAVVELLGDETELTDDHIKQLVKERDYYFGKADSNTQRNDASEKGKANQSILTQEAIDKKKRSISPL